MFLDRLLRTLRRRHARGRLDYRPGLGAEIWVESANLAGSIRNPRQAVHARPTGRKD